MNRRLKHRRREQQPRIESLEPRRLLAAVLFDPNAAGDSTKSVEEWGVDTAWPSAFNVRQSVENIGVENVEVVRVNYYLEHALNGDGSLSTAAKDLMDVQLGLANMAPGVAIALTPSIGNVDPMYFSNGVNVANWLSLMKVSIAYVEQQTGREVTAVEPFNEPDFWAGQGTPQELNTIMTQMVADPAFDGMLIQGGSTLGSQNAQTWWDAISGPANSGSTHVLSGGSDDLSAYAAFMEYVSNGFPGDTPYNPEIHSMAEVLVGADRGMTGGIFWGSVERPLGLAVQASDGVRLGYAEDLSAAEQSAAAVYRAPDGELYGFAGGIERAGGGTQYEFTSTAGPLYFNGIGPITSYAALAERGHGSVVEIDTSAADAVPALDGFRWKIVNRGTGGLLDVFGADQNDGGNIALWEANGGVNQLWDIAQRSSALVGPEFFEITDYFTLNNANSGRFAEVSNWSIDDGANVQQWGVDPENAQKHWYIEATGDGYFYILNALSNKYLAAAENSPRANVVQNSFDGSQLQQWEFVLANPEPSSGAVVAQDASGAFLSGSASGSPVTASGPGLAGGSLVLDGADDYVQLATDVANSSDLTVASWVKWDGGGAWQRLFDFGNNTDEYMFLSPSDGGGRLKFAITTGSWQEELALFADPLTVGQWHHVAVTLGGTTAVLYIDGVAVTAGRIPLNSSDFNPTNNLIGKSQYDDPLFHGEVAGFGIFDFALSGPQIAELASQAGARFDIVAAADDQAEGDGGTVDFTFTVSRGGDTSTAASVDYAVAGAGSHAADATDFGGTLPTGTLSFAAGEVSKSVAISVAADTTNEYDESFTVELSDASANAWIAVSTASGVIRSDDHTQLALANDILELTSLELTEVTLTGTSELHLTDQASPLAGSIVHLDSADAWLFFDGVKPSAVASTYLGQVKVGGAAAVLGGTVQVVQYGNGAVVLPHADDYMPLEVFADPSFAGASMALSQYTAYGWQELGELNDAISSFRLKRGYMATFANDPDGTAGSMNFVAQDGDLEIPVIPSSLNDGVSFVRVFPWRWTTKKGIGGNIGENLDVQWWYDWNIDQSSSLDREYVAIRQARWWPGLDQDWEARGVNHLLGYNEPDHVDQANLAVGDAAWSWPDLEGTGLRLGAPAVTDGGLDSWLYPFIDQIEAEGKRVDFVPVHYYRSYWDPADPVGATNQFHNYLKGVYDRVQRPLWVTEWNNGANWTGDPDPTFEQQAATVAAMVNMLESTPFVERYAIYNWVEDVRRVQWDDGWPTAAGEVYRDTVSGLAYNQVLPAPSTTPSAVLAFDGTTIDSSGNGQPTMAVGAETFVAGITGNALELDGDHDYVKLSPALGDSGDFTFASWVKWDGGANWQRIVDLGADTNNYLFLTPSSGGGKLRFAITTGGWQQEQVLEADALAVGEWTHVAVTIAGTTGKLFVNGEVVATNTAMDIDPSSLGTVNNYLGKSQFAADPLFAGALDEVHVVSSGLSEAEIAALANRPPTAVSFANAVTTIEEGISTASRVQVAGIVVGDDGLGTNTLTLSGPDAASFEIEGEALYLVAGVVLDHETQSAYAVTVSASDNDIAGSAAVSADFTLDVSDINEAPTDVALTDDTVEENAAIGTVVGTFSTSDVDAGDSFTYALVAGAGDTDNGTFEVADGKLTAKAVFDYETQSSYSVRVRSTDAGGLSTEKIFTITVLDLNEAPTAVSLESPVKWISESTDMSVRQKVATVVVTDDALGTNSLALSGAAANSFELDGDSVYLKAGTVLDAEGAKWLSFTVAASDAALSGSDPVSCSWSLEVMPAGDVVVEVAEGASLTETRVYTEGERIVKRGKGTLILTLENAHSGGILVESGEVVVQNGKALNAGPLSVQAGGRLALDVGLTLVAVSDLDLAADGLVDLGESGLSVGAGGFDEAGVRQALIAGRNGGTWDGATGIMATPVSAAAAATGVGVGYQVVGGTLTVRYTANGDAQLDGAVNFDDILALFPNYNAAGSYRWQEGDFTYDGKVDFDDILALFPNYNAVGLWGAGTGGGSGFGSGGGTGTGAGMGDSPSADAGTGETGDPLVGPSPPTGHVQAVTTLGDRPTALSTASSGDDADATSLAFAALAMEGPNSGRISGGLNGEDRDAPQE